MRKVKYIRLVYALCAVFFVLSSSQTVLAQATGTQGAQNDDDNAAYGDHPFYQDISCGGGSAGAAGVPTTLTDVKQQIGQMLFVRVDDQGEATAAIAAGVGGFYVREVAPPEHPSSFLSAEKISGVKSKFKIPPFVATDEEGGQIDPMAKANLAPAMPSAQVLGTKPSAEVSSTATAEAEKMVSVGINVDFAPVLDVFNSNSDAIGKLQRSFSADPAVIVDKAGAFATGLNQGGVTGVYKHFPGIGNTAANSDKTAAPTPPLASLKSYDLIPYEKILGKPADRNWVMMANYSVPDLTNGQPASVSKPAYDLLRNDYKFGGLIITDDLAAGSLSPIAANKTVNPDAAVNAIKAGADIALYSGVDQSQKIIDKLAEAANSDSVLKQHISEASTKILASKAALNGSAPVAATSNGSCACTTGTTNLTGDSNGAKIFNYLVSKGLAPQVAAGFIGNMTSESGLNPRALEPGGVGDAPINGRGFGLIQWTFTSRQQPLVDLAAKEGKPVTDIGVQLDYVIQELTTSYPALYKRLQNIAQETPLPGETSTDKATELIEIYYETHAGIINPGPETNPPQAFQKARRDAANTALAQFGSGAGANATGNAAADSANCSGGASALSGDIGNRIAEVAKQEYAKNGNNCPTGSQCQKNYYDERAGGWCADFVSWVVRQAGSPYTGGNDGGWRIAAVGATRDWFQKNGEYHDKTGYTPRVGDIQIDMNGDPTYPDHVAIVVAVNGNMATIIGGNDGSNLRQSQQSITAPWVTGYGTKTK